MQTNTPKQTPTPAATSQSSPEQEPPEIRDAKAKVIELEASTSRVKAIVVGIAVLAAIAGFSIAAATLKSDWLNDDLRKADQKLTALEMAKITADANNKIAVDTQKVRDEAASQLALKTEEVRGEAGEKIERARADADVKIAEANERTQRVELEVAKQQERALNAERDVIELQERIQPRMIRGEKREAFLSALKDGPKGTVFVLCVVGDIETCLLASDIRSMLSANGWFTGKQLFSMLHMLAENTPIGITLFVKDLQSLPVGASVLKNALTVEAGLPVEIKEKPAMQQAELMELSIGVKPLSDRLKP